MSQRVRRSGERCFIAVVIVVVLVATSAAETLTGRCIKVATTALRKASEAAHELVGVREEGAGGGGRS